MGGGNGIMRFMPFFLKGISPKVNVIARLEFELTNYDVIVKHVNHAAISKNCFSFICSTEPFTELLLIPYPNSWTVREERNGFVNGFPLMLSISRLFNDDFKGVEKSSSSSCRAGSTDIPDPLSPLLPIVHRLRQVFWTTSRILT